MVKCVVEEGLSGRSGEKDVKGRKCRWQRVSQNHPVKKLTGIVRELKLI